MEGGESAENGESREGAVEEGSEEVQIVDGKAKLEDMPDVPTKDPSDDGPAAKKQKPSSDDSL